MMNKLHFLTIGSFALGLAVSQAQLSDGLVSYWPLDEVQGSKTPDLVSGYDMDLSNLSGSDLVAGQKGSAFSMSNANQTLLSRVHNAGEDLPVNQHESYTISMWVNVAGTGQNDLRVFSEGNTEDSNPLFNIGTHNGGADGTVDFFIRHPGWTTINHIHSTNEAFDGNWRHLLFVQENGIRSLYIDGVKDDLFIADKEPGDWLVNNTTIGGILRGSASHWVTGLIDEVAIWKRALSEDEIAQVKSEGLDSVFPPLTIGLVSHWPLDEVQGSKTPDVVSGYDMDLSNMDESNVVEGQLGNAFSFSNADQTLLSRVHNPTDELPVNKHESYTLTMWVNVAGAGQNDLRIFSEGNTEDSNPLFNIGTHNGGADGTVDFFIRHPGWTTVNHIHSTTEAFDGQWRHVAFIQDNGVRTLYVDGTPDDLFIADKEEGDWLVNNTSIGGILRGSASHWVTGLIDEVAVWKRALTVDELQSVVTDGVPEAFKKLLPLEIRTFAPDFAAARAGDTVTLQWDVSKDASVSISGIGDVTGNTVFGVGSVEVTVDEPTVYELTLTRGEETLSASITVGVVADVEEGWRLVDNFDSYAAGKITGSGSWKNPEGNVNVVDLGVNKAVGFDGNGDLAALPLSAQTLLEGGSKTLFFRVYAMEDFADGAVGINVGITEKPIRFNGDFDDDVGAFVRLEKVAGFGPIDILARNGNGSTLDPALESLELVTVYNFWIDVENDLVANGDKFSVYVQKDGESERRLLFENYIGDRNPAGTVELGLPLPDLNHLFIVSVGGNDGIENILLDDFYLSADGFLDTVPVAASPFTFIEPEININLSGAAGDDGFTVTWNSDTGRTYQVEATSDWTTWDVLATQYPTGGATGPVTSYTDASFDAATAGYKYYRVAYVPPPALFEEDFESGAAGWSVVAGAGDSGATTWELGTPVNGPGSANSGSNAYATDLDGDYAYTTDISLRSPLIDLTNVPAATLEFWFFMDIEPAEGGTLFDYGEINVIDASGTPLATAIFQAGGTTSGWRRQSVGLPTAALGQEVRLEFRLFSDEFQPGGALQAGWYIDDIKLTQE